VAEPTLEPLHPTAYRRGEPAYAQAGYARALSDFGNPLYLERARGWLLERPIPGSDARDAMGCYPLFCCSDWSGLAGDLEDLPLVAVSLVADPFGPYGERELSRIFDLVRPLKEHYLVDLSRPVEAVVSKHHRYSARRALESVSVSMSEEPITHLDEWLRLYAVLGRRKGLHGIRAFSSGSFRHHLCLPGTRFFTATVGGTTVGAHWFFVDGDIAYSHLAACDEAGYRLGASYALQWAAIEQLSGTASWLDLGGAPGVSDDVEAGLAWFKRGWATHTAPAHLCGRILDPARYAAFSSAGGGSGYFPGYRKGEFS
jgi:Acetyltransferase (GNAT) domain